LSNCSDTVFRIRKLRIGLLRFFLMDGVTVGSHSHSPSILNV
jgi:hypothetical protein